MYVVIKDAQDNQSNYLRDYYQPEENEDKIAGADLIIGLFCVILPSLCYHPI